MEAKLFEAPWEGHTGIISRRRYLVPLVVDYQQKALQRDRKLFHGLSFDRKPPLWMSLLRHAFCMTWWAQKYGVLIFETAHHRLQEPVSQCIEIHGFDSYRFRIFCDADDQGVHILKHIWEQRSIIYALIVNESSNGFTVTLGQYIYSQYPNHI